MDVNEEDSAQDAEECPVCYESFCGTERTLSCGHGFCHDCLVKTLVSVNSDGNIKDTLVCPICRHLTFIRRYKESLVPLTGDTDVEQRQILEVPVTHRRVQDARSGPARVPSSSSSSSSCCWSISKRVRPQRLISPDHNEQQVFIISSEGRPMAEGDSFSLVMTVVHPQRRRRRICTTAQCLLVLLSLFTVIALIAVTLPWILLA
ncbi:RING finger protein 222 [Gouania willdenowi]|nr:RING finger protein 222 [Gouania willdenowi]